MTLAGELVCDECGRLFAAHRVYHGPIADQHPGDVEARFPGIAVRGLYCPPLGELNVPAAQLLPGDRLHGGQLADGTGQTVRRALPDPFAEPGAVNAVELDDGRTFLVDPDRLFRITRPGRDELRAP